MNPILIGCFSLVIFVVYSQAEICTTGSSPINLDSSKATTDPTKTVTFNYERNQNAVAFQMEIDHDTAIGKAVDGTSYAQYLILDGTKYMLKQMRLRWGAGPDDRTEHSIDGLKYEGEIQLENIKADDSAIGPAMVILSVPLVVSSEKEPEETRQMWSFMSKAKLTIAKPIKANLTDFSTSMKKFLTGPFLRYSGTSTVPLCDIAVEWLAFKLPFPVSTEYFKTLRALVGSDGNSLTKSALKPLQESGTIKVYSYEAPI